MHDSVLAFVERVAGEHYTPGQAVLEIGSRNINGTVRPLFPGADPYVGVDFVAGDGVDVVVEPGPSRFYRRHAGFDVVVSTEALEHDPQPWTTIAGVAHVLRMGGIFIATARGFGPDMADRHVTHVYGFHEYPGDYWRFSVEGMRVLCEHSGRLEVIEIGPDTDPTAPGVFVVARRRPVLLATIVAAAEGVGPME